MTAMPLPLLEKLKVGTVIIDLSARSDDGWLETLISDRSS